MRALILGIMLSIFSGYVCMAQSNTTTDSQIGKPQDSLKKGLGSLLGGIIGSSGASEGPVGNIISSVTGDLTTTRDAIIGIWVYTEPSVQFESDDLMSKAGGAAASSNVESSLSPIYKMAGITPGNLTFSFADDGTIDYALGSKKNVW